ncbi:Taurine catabolism dioxygenase TauD/TfdA [Penicillium occitanis (nom. inval.)]|nr:Taurine catabolism dioxygenase TauD/TfdA [Penicillium occitanis (nom. inval.)]PCH08780.1 hypothetical protein PENOC_012980 [Penicillium occitanis (nom. inval.)]
MQGMMAWDGHLLDPQEGVCQLDSADVAEIGRALEGFKSVFILVFYPYTYQFMYLYDILYAEMSGSQLTPNYIDADMDLDGPEIGTENFSLPTLGPKLAGWAKYIHSERGFCIIRGLDPSIYSVEDGTLVFLGISSYIVCSKHDEIVKLASSWHVYNQLRATKPEVLDEFANLPEKKKSKTYGALHSRLSTLYGIYSNPNQSRNQHQKPRSSFAQEAYRTELFLCDGKVILRASGQPTDSIFGTYNVGPVGDVERMAQDSCTRLILKPGDLLFINNLAVLHAVEDTRQGERHLVKLWLRNERLAWELPRGFQQDMDGLYDRRELRRVWALRPTKRNQSKSGGGEGKEVTIKGRIEAPEGDDDDGSNSGMSIGGNSMGGGSMGGGSMGGWS